LTEDESMIWGILNLGSLILALLFTLVVGIFVGWAPTSMTSWDSATAGTLGIAMGLAFGLYYMFASNRDEDAVSNRRAEELSHKRHFLFNCFTAVLTFTFGSVIFTAIQISFVTTIIIGMVATIYHFNAGQLTLISLRCHCRN
jgi:hypothetical protein